MGMSRAEIMASNTSAYNKKYYEANKEKLVACRKKYCEANKEKIAACNKKYCEANKEKCNAYKKKWTEFNRVNINAKNRNNIASLGYRYIRHSLAFNLKCKAGEIPKSFILVHKEVLQIKRFIRTMK
jgi:hypothetical protein